MASLFVVHQANANTGSSSQMGTFNERKNAERMIYQAKGGPDERFRTSTFYIQEIQAEEVGSDPNQPQAAAAPAPGAPAPGQPPPNETDEQRRAREQREQQSNR